MTLGQMSFFEVAGSTRARAAPAGGAPKGGRGCLIAGLTFGLIATPGHAASSDVSLDLPSGISAELVEVREESDLVRFRFVAPALEDVTDDLSVLAADTDALCTDVALGRIEADGPVRVIISVAAEKTEFGVARPGVLQVFEAYRIEDGRCIWEAF